jgi:hypothetical protein
VDGVAPVLEEGGDDEVEGEEDEDEEDEQLGELRLLPDLLHSRIISLVVDHKSNVGLEPTKTSLPVFYVFYALETVSHHGN